MVQVSTITLQFISKYNIYALIDHRKRNCSSIFQIFTHIMCIYIIFFIIDFKIEALHTSLK